jgi:hypothetical protein
MKKNTELLSYFTAMVLRKDAIIKYIAGKTRGDSAISILNPPFPATVHSEKKD